MSLNKKCPKCGSSNVQVSNVSNSHGCLWTILFGIFYIMWVLIKWMIGLIVLLCLDWWLAIISASRGVGYVWKCHSWFSGKKTVYYCHNCGHNFKG